MTELEYMEGRIRILEDTLSTFLSYESHTFSHNELDRGGGTH